MKDINIAKKYYKETSKFDYYCIIKNEKHENKRIIVEFENYLIIAPYVLRYDYENWVIPEAYNFDFVNIDDIKELSVATGYITKKMKDKLEDPPYNLCIYKDIEENKYYHWHIEIAHRLSIKAGFGLSAGVFVNTVSSEATAKILKVIR